MELQTVRKECYEKLSEFLNEKGARSSLWSMLEKLYTPNGIFLKQREKLSKAQDELANCKSNLQNAQDEIAKIKEYALSHWVEQDMWDAMEIELTDKDNSD